MIHVAGAWIPFDNRVIVISRIPLEAVPIIPSLGNRVRTYGVFFRFLIVAILIHILSGIQRCVSSTLSVYGDCMVVFLVVFPVFRIAIPRNAVVVGQAPVVQILSRQYGCTIGTTNGNVNNSSILGANSLLDQISMELGHVFRCIKGSQSNVLIVGQ